jgi:hypothetical protein
MPAVSALRVAETSEDDDIVHSESISLYLPSACPRGLVISDGLADIERQLQIAQADDALIERWQLLRVTLGLWDYKFSQLGPSQCSGTGAQSLISRFQEKINCCADRYRAACLALVDLDSSGLWSERFLELKAEHVKGLHQGEDDESEGRGELSWIWMVKSHSRPDDLNIQASEEEIGESKHELF